MEAKGLDQTVGKTKGAVRRNSCSALCVLYMYFAPVFLASPLDFQRDFTFVRGTFIPTSHRRVFLLWPSENY